MKLSLKNKLCFLLCRLHVSNRCYMRMYFRITWFVLHKVILMCHVFPRIRWFIQNTIYCGYVVRFGYFLQDFGYFLLMDSGIFFRSCFSLSVSSWQEHNSADMRGGIVRGCEVWEVRIIFPVLLLNWPAIVAAVTDWTKRKWKDCLKNQNNLWLSRQLPRMPCAFHVCLSVCFCGTGLSGAQSRWPGPLPAGDSLVWPCMSHPSGLMWSLVLNG